MDYVPPLKDLLFNLKHLGQLDRLSQCSGMEDATFDTAQAVLDEMGRFCKNEVAPLNQVADQQPSTWHDGEVMTAPGFQDAYRAYCAAGWQGLGHAQQYGGQGLPKVFAAACNEMLNAASLSFALCPLLTDGAIEALMIAGTDQQKELYLPRLIAGEWSGTMNLTEPQAGSDLSLVRTKAVLQDDGTYRVFGTKIFITYGEHDLTSNIVHMVLARMPDAPPGVKGISLFLVPKYVPDQDGVPGRQNDVRCVSIEHKLGIRASPTAVLQFGDHGGATGYLVGQENRGLEIMFIMMNAARFAVGIQGIGIAERATQQAVSYARERRQSRELRPSGSDGSGPAPIIRQPDVRRLLLTMRARTEAARSLAIFAAASCDQSHHLPDVVDRLAAQARYEYLVPLVKGWSTENAVDVTSAGIQVHGGMGFIEETGAAQHWRDSRILPIYEGTTAIQANDLVSRKTLRDKGAAACSLLDEAMTTAMQMKGRTSAEGAASDARLGQLLAEAVEAMRELVGWVVRLGRDQPEPIYAGSVPYLMLAGDVMVGWLLIESIIRADADSSVNDGFIQAKRATAHFYAETWLSQIPSRAIAITRSGAAIMMLDEKAF